MDSEEREHFKQFLLDGLTAYPVEAEVLQGEVQEIADAFNSMSFGNLVL